MFTKKQFFQRAILAIAVMAVTMWSISQALAALPPEPSSKADGSSPNKIETSGAYQQPMTSEQPMKHYRSSLEGKEYVGKMTDPTDNTKSYDETIAFRNGKFHSAACDAYGFGMASYTTKKDKGATVFTTETTSNKDGHVSQLIWHGTIKGKELDATAEMITDGKPSGTSSVKAMLETQQTSITK
jgi:hypothetical protein